MTKRVDPFAFKDMFWPSVYFYDKQREIIQSVEDNDETYVHAGNQLGKDFVAGFIVLKQFLCNPVCRIVTTSVKDDHLRVLWGEIGRYVQTARHPLLTRDGGPLVVNHREIRKIIGGKRDEVSYLIGQVSEKGEGMAGHHAPYTLGVIDEASGVDELVYTQMCTWAKKLLIFGNCNPCPTNHFFYRAYKEGDRLAK